MIVLNRKNLADVSVLLICLMLSFSLVSAVYAEDSASETVQADEQPETVSDTVDVETVVEDSQETTITAPEETLPEGSESAASHEALPAAEQSDTVLEATDAGTMPDASYEVVDDAASEQSVAENALDTDGVAVPAESELTKGTDVPDAEEDVEEVKPAPLYVIDLISTQRRAVADNPSIAAGAERIEQVRQMVAQARSLYLPQVDMSYTYSLNWLPSSYTDSINNYLDETESVLRDWRKDFITQSTITRQPSLRQRRDARRWYNSTMDMIEDYRNETESPIDNTMVSLTAGWLVFDGFAREFLNAMARHGYSEAQAAFRDGQRILLDAVAQAYYGVQIAREQVEIAKSDIAFYQRLHKEALARREVGRGATSHVLSFETLLYAARAGRLQAERNYEMARVILGMLMGLPEGRLDDRFELAVLEEETPETMTLPDEDAMVELALNCRPDLEQREFGLKRADAAVKQQYASFSPLIALVGQMQTANVTESGFSSDRITSTIGLNASLNLFSGGRRRASIIEAKHARREAELRIVEAEQKVMSDVYKAMEDLKIAQEALKLQRQAAECVEKNRDLVEMEYNAGKAMLVSLSQAQRDYMQAAGMLAQARVNLQRTWQALHAATGTNLAILTENTDSCEAAKDVSTECCETNKTELTEQNPE